MRRVLLIHYHFLPVHNVAVKQLLGYARHLPALGWQPIVLTNDWKDLGDDARWGLSWEPDVEMRFPLEIERVAARPPLALRVSRRDDPWPLRKLRSAIHVLAGSYPDGFASWIGPATARAVDLIRRRAIDAVLTYCPPETNHVVGSRIARATGVPWLAFFGDLHGFFLAPLARRSAAAPVSRWCHRRWLAPAAAFAAVSPYMRDYLVATYGRPARLVLVGFDPGEFDGAVRERTAPETFLLSHVGSLYPGNQQPEIFFDGLDLFLRARPEAAARIRVRFVGSKCDAFLRTLAQARPAGSVTSVLPKVSSTAAASMVGESDALLAFNCTAFRDRHGTLSYPSKVFEALGARRPVLAVPPDGDWVDSLLARTRGGRTAGTAAEVADVLGDWFASWRRSGSLGYEGDENEIAAFSHERQAGRLAALLDDVAAGAAGRGDRRQGQARGYSGGTAVAGARPPASSRTARSG
jgi:hypothetical protein